MANRELPTNERVEMNQHELAKVLKIAFVNALPFVYRSSPQQKLYTIWRPIENGAAAYTLALPNSISIWEPFNEALDNGAFDDLESYLWDHGVPRVTVMVPDPDRKAWSRWAINQYLRPTMVQWLEDMFIQSAIDGLNPIPWPMISDDVLDGITSLQARLICKDEVMVRAYFYPHAVRLPTDTPEIQLGNDITLRNLDEREKRVVLSTSAPHVLWDEFIPFPGLDTLCEIKQWVPRTEMGTVNDKIIEKLNVLKLALTLTKSDLWKNAEGVVLIATQSPTNYRGISRLMRRHGTQWSGLDVGGENLEILRGHFEALEQGISTNPDIKFAVWRFGRACTADVSQDQVVEAVIGMESLLVPNPGESTYRFSLHGAAMLCEREEDPGQLVKSLRDLYSQRSGGVHGRSRAEKLDGQANEAVIKLAHLIRNIIAMQISGELSADGKIAKSIEQFVLRRVIKQN